VRKQLKRKRSRGFALFTLQGKVAVGWYMIGRISLPGYRLCSGLLLLVVLRVNPEARNFFGIVAYLQKREGLHLKVPSA
jgi:hypothetical protein